MTRTTKRGKPMATNEYRFPLDEARIKLDALKKQHQELTMQAYNFGEWVDSLPGVRDNLLSACAAVLRANLSAHYEWSDPISNMLEPYKERDNSTFGEPTT